MPVQEWHIVPEHIDVPMRRLMPVKVTHYSSPTKLFLRYNSDSAGPNDNGAWSPAPGVPHVYEICIGTFCLVYEEQSQQFLRGQVTDVHKNTNGIQVAAEVFYVDQGGSDIVGLDCVFPITAETASKPSMTTSCCIRKVRPTSRSSRLDLERVTPHSQVLFEAIFCGKSDAGVYDVDLFVTDPKAQPTKPRNVADLLVHYGFAELLRYPSGTTPTAAKPPQLMNGGSASNHTIGGPSTATRQGTPAQADCGSCVISKLPPTTVPTESCFEVEVTFTCSPHHWYGQLIGLKGNLLEVQRNIAECDLERCAASDVRRGRYYIYRDLPQQPAVRVRVEELEKTDTNFQARVFFVDYGNRKTVSSLCLYKMNSKLSQQCPLALRFQLTGVEPWNVWTDSDVSRFAELTHSRLPLVAVLTDRKQSSDHYRDNILIVSLRSKTEGDIAECLIREGHARATRSSIRKIERSAILGFFPMEEDYRSPLNSYKVDTDDPGVATADFAVKDEKRICKFFSSQGYCRQGEYCIYKHILGESNSVLLHVKEEVPMGVGTLRLPKEGSTVIAQVSYAVSPSNFYLIFPYGCRPAQHLSEKASSLYKETLEGIMKNLQAVYGRDSFNEDRLLHKSEGELVAARSRNDKQWYRARVVGFSSDGDAMRVAFPDFGDEEWVPASCVKALEARFLRLPFQAVQACLADVEPGGCDREHSWSTEARVAFVNYTAGKDLLAEVLGCVENQVQVKLHFFDSDQLHSVGDCLQSSRHAQFLNVQHQNSALSKNMPCPG